MIRRNFDIKVASLVIAVGLWFMFNYLSTSSQAYSTTLQIPVTLYGVAAGLVATSDVQSVTVELAGPRAVVEKLAPSDFAAYIDCSGKDAGPQSLGVSIAGPDSDKIHSISPATAVVILDRFGYRTVPVISSGGLNTDVADIQPRTIVVSGGETTLARVMAARVSIEEATTDKPFVVMLKPIPVDANFAAVSGVNVVPPTVRVALVPHRSTPR